MSLVSYLPSLPPPLHTSPQLTETQQCPTCTCWPSPLTLLFFWSHLLGLGKALPPTPCHPGGPIEIWPWPVLLEQGLLLLRRQEPAPWQQCSVPPAPSSSPRVRGSCGLLGLHRWHFPSAAANIVGHWVPNGSLFPSAQTHVQAGHCWLLWLCLVLKEQV